MPAEVQAKKHKRFKDFAKETDIGLDGSKIKMDKILNQEVLLTGFRVSRSKAIKDKDLLTIQLQFQEGGDKLIVFTNSTVLMKQLHDYKDELPFWTVIQKKGSYYCLT